MYLASILAVLIFCYIVDTRNDKCRRLAENEAKKNVYQTTGKRPHLKKKK